MEHKAVTLNNGHKMPIVGMGVWRADPGVIHDLILDAIKIGYRHFDCAGNTLFAKSHHKLETTSLNFCSLLP